VSMSQRSSELVAPAETHGTRAARTGGKTPILEYDLRDVRRFPLLSHELERVLAQYLQEEHEQWCTLLLNHLLYTPLLLSWGPKIRRGLFPVPTFCRAGVTPAACIAPDAAMSVPTELSDEAVEST